MIDPASFGASIAYASANQVQVINCQVSASCLVLRISGININPNLGAILAIEYLQKQNHVSPCKIQLTQVPESVGAINQKDRPCVAFFVRERQSIFKGLGCCGVGPKVATQLRFQWLP